MGRLQTGWWARQPLDRRPAGDLIDYSGVGIPNSTLYLGGTLEQGTWTLENLAQEKEGACSRH